MLISTFTRFSCLSFLLLSSTRQYLGALVLQSAYQCLRWYLSANLLPAVSASAGLRETTRVGGWGAYGCASQTSHRPRSHIDQSFAVKNRQWASHHTKNAPKTSKYQKGKNNHRKTGGRGGGRKISVTKNTKMKKNKNARYLLTQQGSF